MPFLTAKYNIAYSGLFVNDFVKEFLCMANTGRGLSFSLQSFRCSIVFIVKTGYAWYIYF